MCLLWQELPSFSYVSFKILPWEDGVEVITLKSRKHPYCVLHSLQDLSSTIQDKSSKYFVNHLYKNSGSKR